MLRWGRGTGRFGVGVLVACLLLAQMTGIARAQDAGWYGPYDDSCYHWWDGYQWTSDVDCDGDGYTDNSTTTYPADWYGPYDDGCYHWWDGYQWTNDIDCDGDGYTDVATFAAGWYGPFDNGCNYWWNGNEYSGEYDCDGDGYTDDTEETYQPGWYDLYGDGCLYWYDGSAYTGDVDCNGDGAADTSQQPNNVDTSSTDQYIEAQLAAINKMWGDRFRASGMDYADTRVVLATQPVSGGCTTKDGDLLVETEDWIFYCPGDRTIYSVPRTWRRSSRAASEPFSSPWRTRSGTTCKTRSIPTLPPSTEPTRSSTSTRRPAWPVSGSTSSIARGRRATSTRR